MLCYGGMFQNPSINLWIFSLLQKGYKKNPMVCSHGPLQNEVCLWTILRNNSIIMK